MNKLVFFLLTVCSVFSQEEVYELPVDSLFREDQFYVSLSYNLLRNKPEDYSQYSFSSGVTLGFLRDIPISKDRKWGIGAGLGYSYSDIKHNLKIDKVDDVVVYSVDNVYDKCKLRLHYLEIPIEFRWRNATYTSHKFWRVYTGFKFSYLISSNSILVVGDREVRIRNNKDIQKMQYGPYLSIGYNTVNLYAYYGLKSHFEGQKIVESDLNLNSFNLGFIFYIL